MVTVALARTSSRATGMPTMLERPKTTALAPFRLGRALSMKSMQPAGVQGTNSGSRPFCARRPMLSGWKPSTSFSMLTALSTRSSSKPEGRGNCTRMPLTCGVGVELAHQGFHFALGGGGRQLITEGLDANLLAGFVFGFDIGVRSGVVSHQNGRQTGGGFAFCHTLRDFFSHCGAGLLSQFGTIQEMSCHKESFRYKGIQPYYKAGASSLWVTESGSLRFGGSRSPPIPKMPPFLIEESVTGSILNTNKALNNVSSGHFNP